MLLRLLSDSAVSGGKIDGCDECRWDHGDQTACHLGCTEQINISGVVRGIITYDTHPTFKCLPVLQMNYYEVHNQIVELVSDANIPGCQIWCNFFFKNFFVWVLMRKNFWLSLRIIYQPARNMSVVFRERPRRTAAEWIKLLPEAYRREAKREIVLASKSRIRRRHSTILTINYDSLWQTIERGIIWDRSRQGTDFWMSIYTQLRENNDDVTKVKWYKTIPKPYSDMAIRNFKSQHKRQGELSIALRFRCTTLIHALNTFVWSSTPEGSAFWERIESQVRYHNGDMTKVKWPEIPSGTNVE